MEIFYESNAINPEMFQLECTGAEFDIIMEDFSIMENVLEKSATLNLEKADLRCFLENGTIDDLGEMYMEAAEASTGKKKNLLCRMIDAIIKFISDIANAIADLFRKKETHSDGIVVCADATPEVEEAIKKERKRVADMETIVKGIEIGAVAAVGVAIGKGIYDAKRNKKVNNALRNASTIVNITDEEKRNEIDLIDDAIKRCSDDIARRRALIPKMTESYKKLSANVRPGPAKDTLEGLPAAKVRAVEDLKKKREGLMSDRRKAVDYLNADRSKKVLHEVSNLLKDNESLMKLARKKINAVDPKDPNAFDKINVLQRIIQSVSGITRSAQKVVASSATI